MNSKSKTTLMVVAAAWIGMWCHYYGNDIGGDRLSWFQRE